MDALLRRRLMMLGGAPTPPQPQRIDFAFLRSFGNCAIDTEVGNGTSTANLGLQGRYTFRPSAAGQWLIQAALANGNSLGLQALGTTGTKMQTGDGADHKVSGVALGSDNSIKIGGGEIETCGHSLALTATTLASDISLFADGTPGNYAIGDLQPLEISIGGTKVRDLQPCIDPDGLPALYDKESGRYFHSTGTGRLHAGNYTISTVIGSMGSSQLQGLAVYGDIAVRMANSSTSTTHRVYRITSGSVTEIATFTLAGCGHANALQFAGTLESGQTLPYMSVTDLTGVCYVLSFNSSYQATIVQTISLDGISSGQVLKDDQNYVWSSWTNASGNRHFRKYRQVLVSEGASVTLTDADILDEWDTYETFPSEYFTMQGWKIKGGRLYLLYGAGSGLNKVKGITVYDTATHRTVDQYDMTNAWVTSEPEDLDFFNGEVVVAPLTGSLHFVRKDSRLIPEGYTQVQYIEMTGSQAVTFALTNASEATDAVELDAQLTTVTAQMRLITSTSINCQTYVNGSLGLGYRHNNTWKGLSGVTFDTSRHRSGVDYQNKNVWFDGTIEAFTGSSSSTTGSNSIGVGVAYSTQPRLKAKVYAARVWRYNEKIRDIIFLRDNENTPYAYDMARAVFRAITGDVTLGPDVQ